AYDAPSVLDMLSKQPPRPLYVQRASIPNQELGGREVPNSFTVEVVPAQVLSGPSLGIEVSVAPPPDASFVHVHVDTGSAATEVLSPVPPTNGGGGTELQPVTVGVGGLALQPEGQIAITLGWGATEEEAASSPQVRQAYLY